MASEAEGIFRRFHFGVLSFAAVRVSHDPPPAISEVVDVMRALDCAEVEDVPPEALVSAAKIGVLNTVMVLKRRGKVQKIGTINITRLMWRWPDTMPDAVECAAGIAISRLFSPHEPEPRTHFSGRWVLDLWEEDGSQLA